MSLSQLDFLLPFTVTSPLLAFLFIVFSFIWFSPGGIAWAFSRSTGIPGPAGISLSLSGSLAHRVLAKLSVSFRAIKLMAFSVGSTRFIVSSHPDTAKEILGSSAFADRPINESAYELLFHRAMGFAPFGEYWRSLRRISATYLFSQKRIAAFGAHRKDVGLDMVRDIGESMGRDGEVAIKRVLHFASLNSVMGSVFGKRFDFGSEEGAELEEMVREGYELLGAFNWGDHFPLLGWLDLHGVRRRCRSLVGRVNVFVGKIIEEHRRKGSTVVHGDNFVDVLLGLEEEERLSDSDMVAVLWVSSMLMS